MFRVACRDSHASNHVDSQNIWTRRLRRSVRNQVRMRATHGLRMHLLNQPSRWSVTRRAALQPDVVFSSITIFHPLLRLLLFFSLSSSLLLFSDILLFPVIENHWYSASDRTCRENFWWCDIRNSCKLEVNAFISGWKMIDTMCSW